MFAYCNNNPVCFSDPTGRSFWGIVATVAALILAVTGCASEPEPEFDYSIVPDLDVNTADHLSYNCFGNAIGKEMIGDPPDIPREIPHVKPFRLSKISWVTIMYVNYRP